MFSKMNFLFFSRISCRHLSVFFLDFMPFMLIFFIQFRSHFFGVGFSSVLTGETEVWCVYLCANGPTRRAWSYLFLEFFPYYIILYYISQKNMDNGPILWFRFGDGDIKT